MLMKKNVKIHLIIESDTYEALKKEAIENDLSFAEIYRQKLRQSPALKRIEMILERIESKIDSKASK